MQERRGDLWVLAHELNVDAVCITTNGYLKKNGDAVLGRGCALEAVQRWPWIPEVLGKLIQHSGNKVYLFKEPQHPTPYHLVNFPVKRESVVVNEHKDNILPWKRVNYRVGQRVPGFAALADINLIAKSAGELINLLTQQGWQRVLLPRPGCGNGGLDWVRDVQPVLSHILDDRVIVVSK